MPEVLDGARRALVALSAALATRELCIVAMLAVWDAPRQLHSHLRGALNAGATVEEVGAALALACDCLGDGRAAPVRELWERVAASYQSDPTDSR